VKTFKDLKQELLQNPEVKAEYERLRPEFELAEIIIAARAAQGLTQAELAIRMAISHSNPWQSINRLQGCPETSGYTSSAPQSSRSLKSP